MAATPPRPRARSPRCNRQITATDADGSDAETLSNLIQVQADVQPGDSGGALVDSDGEVIGMTTAASSSGFRFQEETAGVGFAIRIDKAMSIVKLIRNGEEVDGVHVGSRGMLGVSLQTELSLAPGGRNTPSTGDGAEVIDVTEDGPAADAGIETGDIIISIGDATISSSTDLSTEMDRYTRATRSRWAGPTPPATPSTPPSNSLRVRPPRYSSLAAAQGTCATAARSWRATRSLRSLVAAGV